MCAVCDRGLGKPSLVAGEDAFVGPVRPNTTIERSMSSLVYTSRDSVCPHMSQFPRCWLAGHVRALPR